MTHDQQRKQEIKQGAEPFSLRFGIDGDLQLRVLGKIIPQHLFIILYVGDPEFELGAVFGDAAGPAALIELPVIIGLGKAVFLDIYPYGLFVGYQVEFFNISLAQHIPAEVKLVDLVCIGSKCSK